MLTDYARYLWFRLTHTWCGLVYAVLYVAISLASGASVARSLRGFMAPVAHEQWHTDCLGVYGDIVVFGTIVGSMFVAWLFLSDLRTGFAKNVFSGRRARPAYAASMVAVAAAVSLALLVVGIAVVELAFFVSPSWLDRPGAGACLAWFGQAFLYCMLLLCVAALAACLVRNLTAGMAVALVVPYWLAMRAQMRSADAGASAVPAWLEPCLPSTNCKLLMDGEVPGLEWTLAALAGIVLVGAAIMLVMGRKRLA